MSLVLELPAETEAQLRQAAARERATPIDAISLDEAAHILNAARNFILESVAKGELSGETREGEIFVLADEKFEALRQQQAETQAGLVEVARINSALGL